MSTLVDEVVAALQERHAATQRIDLNDIAEVIGTRAVSYDDVEQIIARLERDGCSVAQTPTAHEMGLLQQVLRAARKLRGELGRNPTVDEIADRSKVPSFVVRRALENAHVMGRDGETK